MIEMMAMNPNWLIIGKLEVIMAANPAAVVLVYYVLEYAHVAPHETAVNQYYRFGTPRPF